MCIRDRGSNIGSFNTICLIFLTAIIGVYFVRQQGLSTFQRLANQIQKLETPIQTVGEGLVILLSGVLLITPGFLTDAIGFLGLIPFTRIFFIKLVATFILSRYGVYKKKADDTIEADYFEIDESEGDNK